MAWSPIARTLKFPRRFVSITWGRSGSELLTSLLDSHPAVVSEGEIIHLRRRNLLNQALSLLHAERSRYHVRTNEGTPFEPSAIDPERLLAQLYHYEDDDRWLTKLVADIPHLDLTYEDDLVDGPSRR